MSDVHLQFQTVPKYFFYIFYSGNFVYWKIYFTFAKFSNGNYFKLVNNIQIKRELWRDRER